MSEENKPIFPRSTESSVDEKAKLRQQAKLNLENEEQKFPVNQTEQTIICPKCQTVSPIHVSFCRVCGTKLDMSAPLPPDNYAKVLTLKNVHILAPNMAKDVDEAQKPEYTDIQVRRHLPLLLYEVKENQPVEIS